MHPFIHPLTKAVDPAWESRSDWDIFKGVARAVSDMAPGVLGVEQDVVLVPTQHDTPGELAMPFDVRDWKKGECDPIPGRTMPSISVVERDYPNLYRSEEHTSELQSLMRTSYAVFCSKKKYTPSAPDQAPPPYIRTSHTHT